MVEVITGVKGTGKTKRMLDRANADVKKCDGSVIYVDKNDKHSFEIDSKIRLINLGEYPIETLDGFIGFLSGMISQNSDIQEIFLDSFLTIGKIVSDEEIVKAIETLDTFSQKFKTNFVISLSKDKEEVPASLQSKII